MVNDSKPGAKMFEEAMSITKLKANEICHVGDHPVNDIEGALKVGFKAIWLNALENSWPDGQKCHVPEVRNWKDLESTIAAF
jgi:FMN phosphatase YigB (HAD superfamily)